MLENVFVGVCNSVGMVFYVSFLYDLGILGFGWVGWK